MAILSLCSSLQPKIGQLCLFVCSRRHFGSSELKAPLGRQAEEKSSSNWATENIHPDGGFSTRVAEQRPILYSILASFAPSWQSSHRATPENKETSHSLNSQRSPFILVLLLSCCVCRLPPIVSFFRPVTNWQQHSNPPHHFLLSVGRGSRWESCPWCAITHHYLLACMIVESGAVPKSHRPAPRGHAAKSRRSTLVCVHV